MKQYIIRRLLQMVPLLLVMSVLLFALVNLAPGGPLAGSGQSKRLSPEKAATLRRQYGLDQPLPVQYVVWLFGNDWMKLDLDGNGQVDGYGSRRGVLRGDFGVSYQSRKPVLDEIKSRLPNTIYLMGITLLVVALIAIPLGVISAVKQYSKFDMLATTLAFMGQAVPEFWLGLVLIIVFYGLLRSPVTGEPLLPAGGMYTVGAEFSLLDWARHLVLPVLMGMVGWVAWYSRFLRSSMLDVINKDFVRAARAKGASWQRVLFRHALKNAAIPLVTVFALDLPYIFAGSVYVELIFAWPGMGRLFYQAALYRDYPVLMAVLVVVSAMVLVSSLLADILYAALDPRVRYD
ncbi:MAG: ABC transporter permease [Chloroflexota bacterium]